MKKCIVIYKSNLSPELQQTYPIFLNSDDKEIIKNRLINLGVEDVHIGDNYLKINNFGSWGIHEELIREYCSVPNSPTYIEDIFFTDE